MTLNLAKHAATADVAAEARKCCRLRQRINDFIARCIPHPSVRGPTGSRKKAHMAGRTASASMPQSVLAALARLEGRVDEADRGQKEVVRDWKQARVQVPHQHVQGKPGYEPGVNANSVYRI